MNFLRGGTWSPISISNVSSARTASSRSTLSIVRLAANLHSIERRLGDEQMALVEHALHVAEEERQKQGPNVGPVHVGVGHDQHPVVPQPTDVETLPDARPQRGDHLADLFV